jgi:hypothetical protein
VTGKAGDIAAGPRETRNKATANRITDPAEHNLALEVLKPIAGNVPIVQWWNDQPEQMRIRAAELIARSPDVAVTYTRTTRL